MVVHVVVEHAVHSSLMYAGAVMTMKAMLSERPAGHAFNLMEHVGADGPSLMILI